MTKRKYKSIKRHIKKAYKLLINNDVVFNKQEYAEIKIKMKSLLERFERNDRQFARELKK